MRDWPALEHPLCTVPKYIWRVVLFIFLETTLLCVFGYHILISPAVGHDLESMPRGTASF